MDAGALFVFLMNASLDGLERLHVEDVVRVVERRLLVVKGRKAHPLEVLPVALLAAHHDPHGAPLRLVDRLNDFGSLVDKGDGARNVIQDLDCTFLFPRHGHVLQEFEDCVRNILQRS